MACSTRRPSISAAGDITTLWPRAGRARHLTSPGSTYSRPSSPATARAGRSVHPFPSLYLGLVAVPSGLPVGREVVMGLRIVIGVVIGLGFYLFDKMFNHLGLVYELNPIVAVSLPTLLTLGGVGVVLWRIRAN